LKDPKELEKELARLESTHDHLSTELQNLNDMLKQVGFHEGLETLKQAALDLEALEEEDSEDPSP
jgi:hypothetical protein